MKTYKSIAAVQQAVQAGELDESQLRIVQDNDCSHIYFGPSEDEDGEEIENTIFTGQGYSDTWDLWPLVFPNAEVTGA